MLVNSTHGEKNKKKVEEVFLRKSCLSLAVLSFEFFDRFLFLAEKGKLKKEKKKIFWKIS